MNLPKEFIACNIEYFSLGKDILVMKDENIEHVKCENIDNLPKILYNISKEKQIKEIIISGQKDIATNMAETIMNYEMNEYNKHELKITLI